MGPGLLALLIVGMAVPTQLAIIGPLLPEIQAELGISYAVASILAVLPLLCMGIFTMAAPWFMSRISAGRGIAASVFLIGGFGLLRAASPSQEALLALTLPIGLGMGLAGVFLAVWVKAEYGRRIGTATATYSIGFQSGAGIAALFAIPFAAYSGSWRLALGVAAAFAIGAGAAWLTTATRGQPLEPRSSSTAVDHRRNRDLVRATTVVSVIFALRGFVYQGLLAWIPSVYVEEFGWEAAQAGALAAVLSLVGIPASIFVAPRLDRADRVRAVLLGGSILLVIPSLGLLIAPSWGFLWLSVVGVAMGALIPATFALPGIALSDTRSVGTASTVMLSIGYLLAAISPFAFGLLRDTSGSFVPGLALSATCSIGLLAVVIAALRSRPLATISPRVAQPG